MSDVVASAAAEFRDPSVAKVGAEYLGAGALPRAGGPLHALGRYKGFGGSSRDTLQGMGVPG
ncbi:hypothetical protein ABZ746_02325 [Streptomyces sp. NPDC020096]